tara:strand:+ start:60419 stop:61390 length:972 start_codon:yes stop_codon:yes gene_type:complete
VNKYSKLIVSIIFSFVGIYFSFYKVNYEELIFQLSNIHLLPLLVSVFLLILAAYLRALRWKYILKPISNIGTQFLFSSVMIGYFGNNVLPFRMGEILRTHSVSSRCNIQFPKIFGTVILERIIDLCSLIFIFVIVAPWFPFQNANLKSGILVLVIFTSALVISISFFYYVGYIENIKDWDFFKSQVGKKIFPFIESTFRGLTLLSKANNIFGICLTTIIIWVFYFGSTYAVLISCDINIGYVGACIILIIGGLIIAIPSLPSAAGTYDAGIKYSLIAVYFISSEKALSYALISHATMFFPYVIIGAVYFIFSNLNYNDIKKQS